MKSIIRLPRRNKQWAKEASDALEFAWKLLEEEHEAKEKLYKYGPMICLQNRGITDKEKIKKTAEHAFRERLNDFEVDPDSINNYSINFYLAYLDSHVSLGVLSEQKVHEIMEYIIENVEILD